MIDCIVIIFFSAYFFFSAEIYFYSFLSWSQKKKTFDMIIVYAMYSGKSVVHFTWTSLKKQGVNVKNFIFFSLEYTWSFVRKKVLFKELFTKYNSY